MSQRDDIQGIPSVDDIRGTENSSLSRKDECTSSDQCGDYADCIYDGHRYICWCVNDLKAPDPVSRECRATHSDGFPNHKSILDQDTVQSVFKELDNITHGRHHNETPANLSSHSVLQQESDSSPFTHIIIPVLGFSVVFISLLIFLVYRGRYLKKQGGAKRISNTIRQNDGAVLLDRMNIVRKNPAYFDRNECAPRKLNLRQVPVEWVKLIEAVGEGAFGQVFRGELFSPESRSSVTVAVKVLKDGLSSEASKNFAREVEVTSTFDHDNILKLLAVVAQGANTGPYMIFEYMEYGDLTKLLRKNDPEVWISCEKSLHLSKTDLVDISVQIANGMCYLSSQRFVHRDLATRNCLVNSGLVVKISDFGMSRDIYTNDYYKIGGSRLLPVRWMSPEAIKYGHFTSESDIWAYGVVLWEIFTFGKQPYYGHSNEEVINLLDQSILLQRPEDCPSTVYHIMLGCWKRDPGQRLAFDRLVKYLCDYRDRIALPVHIQPQQIQTITATPRPLQMTEKTGNPPLNHPSDSTADDEATAVYDMRQGVVLEPCDDSPSRKRICSEVNSGDGVDVGKSSQTVMKSNVLQSRRSAASNQPRMDEMETMKYRVTSPRMTSVLHTRTQPFSVLKGSSLKDFETMSDAPVTYADIQVTPGVQT